MLKVPHPKQSVTTLELCAGNGTAFSALRIPKDAYALNLGGTTSKFVPMPFGVLGLFQFLEMEKYYDQH